MNKWPECFLLLIGLPAVAAAAVDAAATQPSTTVCEIILRERLIQMQNFVIHSTRLGASVLVSLADMPKFLSTVAVCEMVKVHIQCPMDSIVTTNVGR